MIFSIIIAASRIRGLKKCLDSLFSQEINQKEIEIIVVAEVNLIKAFKHDTNKIKFVESKRANPAFKRNLGAKASSGGILAFIDDDAYAPKNWLVTTLSMFRNDPGLDGIMGPTLLPPNVGLLEQISQSVLASQISGQTNFAKSEYRYEQPNLGDITLCNMFIKREVFYQVGEFNEFIGYGSEDSELIFTAIDKYHRRIIYYSELFVWHHRREFGFGYLKQRFVLRKSTGKLMLIYPKRYLWNRKIGSFFVGISSYLLFLLFFPRPGIILFIFGFFILTILSGKILREHFLVGLIWPYALMAHFVASYLGVLSGLLSWTEINNLRRHRRF